MDKLTLVSNAKINLGLLIKGKRSDGYHLLETLFYPVTVADEIYMEKRDDDEFFLELEGLTLDCEIEQNLCYKAWKLLRSHRPEVGGVDVLLLKKIPLGSGLGGGSSNAAFVLKGLRDLYAPGVSDHELILLASQLGSDVPFFIFNRPMFAHGTGTELEDFHIFLPYEIKIVTPAIHSSTVEAYKSLDVTSFDSKRSLKELLKLPVADWKDNVVNDLETPVFAKYPELKKTKQDLYDQGAVYAAMSGSGSAVFGLFDS